MTILWCCALGNGPVGLRPFESGPSLAGNPGSGWRSRIKATPTPPPHLSPTGVRSIQSRSALFPRLCSHVNYFEFLKDALDSPLTLRTPWAQPMPPSGLVAAGSRSLDETCATAWPSCLFVRPVVESVHQLPRPTSGRDSAPTIALHQGRDPPRATDFFNSLMRLCKPTCAAQPRLWRLELSPWSWCRHGTVLGRQPPQHGWLLLLYRWKEPMMRSGRVVERDGFSQHPSGTARDLIPPLGCLHVTACDALWQCECSFNRHSWT